MGIDIPPEIPVLSCNGCADFIPYVAMKSNETVWYQCTKQGRFFWRFYNGTYILELSFCAYSQGYTGILLHAAVAVSPWWFRNGWIRTNDCLLSGFNNGIFFKVVLL